MTATLEFNGLTLANGDGCVWVSLDGWEDLPGIEDASVPRPSAHGATPGRLLAEGRIVTWQGVLLGLDVAEVRAALTITDAELPITVDTGSGSLRCWGRVTARAIPGDVMYAAGAASVTVQWACSDPRRYRLAEQSLGLRLSAPPSGASWPVTWPVTWPNDGVGGSGFAVNDGDVASPVVAELYGPLVTPSLTVGDQVLEFDLTLTAGDVLAIDAANGSALLNGSARDQAITARSVTVDALLVPPGGADVALGSAVYDPSASAVLRAPVGAYL